MTMQEVLADIQSGRKKKVILDTDTYNEVDDQYALAYCYLSEKMDLLAVQAAGFHNEKSEGFADGMERSYQEIHKVLHLIDPDYTTPVFRGCTQRMTDVGGAVDSDATENLIRMVRESEEVVYVLVIGAITNVTSAILKAPDIKEKMVVVWLGSNDLEHEDIREFNLFQDFLAGHEIVECGVPLVLCPAFHVTAALTADMELIRELNGYNAVCDYLVAILEDRFRGRGSPEGWKKVIWDIAAPSILATPQCATLEIMEAPILQENYQYGFAEGRHEILFLRKIDREIVFDATWKLLKQGKK